MSQNEDYQRLARKFVDAWQEQMASLSNDGEFIHTLLQMMQMPGFSDSYGAAYAKSTASHSPASQSAGSHAAAPDARDAALVRIENTLQSIEKRLAKLELRASADAKRVAKPAAAPGGNGGNVPKPRRRPAARSGGAGRNPKKGR